MPSTMDLHKVTRFVSDGTGLTEEEVRLWGAVTATVVVVTGLLHAIEGVRRQIYKISNG